ncbi:MULTISPECIES: DnaT-like ssDNA-binding protein [unclassified Inquilinus]|uniref:DnaT-like ssDNA-binding protein n=1 Tax=unclassified Inquilinus TaxID=2645927 RepID=UPI003F8E0BFC
MGVVVGVNSYVTVAEGDTYFADRLNSSEWTAATSDDKGKALVMAARQIDRLSFTGALTSASQAMSWPRIGASDREGRPISSTVVPQDVKDAQAETALAFLRGDMSDGGDRGIQRVKAGSVEVEYDSTAPVRTIPDIASSMLAPFLAASGVNSVRLVP